eukprot:gene9710-11924_t
MDQFKSITSFDDFPTERFKEQLESLSNSKESIERVTTFVVQNLSDVEDLFDVLLNRMRKVLIGWSNKNIFDETILNRANSILSGVIRDNNRSICPNLSEKEIAKLLRKMDEGRREQKKKKYESTAYQHPLEEFLELWCRVCLSLGLPIQKDIDQSDYDLYHKFKNQYVLPEWMSYKILDFDIFNPTTTSTVNNNNNNNNNNTFINGNSEYIQQQHYQHQQQINNHNNDYIQRQQQQPPQQQQQQQYTNYNSSDEQLHHQHQQQQMQRFQQHQQYQQHQLQYHQQLQFQQQQNQLQQNQYQQTFFQDIPYSPTNTSEFERFKLYLPKIIRNS